MKHEALPVRIEPIAIFRDYGTLIELLKEEKRRCGRTGEEIDALAGFTERHTQKLLTWPPKPWSRGLGALTMPTILEVLGVAFMLVRLPPKVDIPPVDQQQFKAVEG